MVGVAQLAERKNVALEAAGSNPVTHPIFHFRSKLPHKPPSSPIDKLPAPMNYTGD
jgi:hypothetical protein